MGKERPSNVVQYMQQWLEKKGQKVAEDNEKKQQKKIEGMDSSSQDSSSDEEEFIPRKPKNMGARVSVSGEAFGRFNKKEDFKPKFVKKSSDQIERISKRLGQSFMFSALDDNEQEIVIGAMEEVHFKPDDTVIKQGDDGDVLYVIDEGTLDCYKKFKPDGDNTYLKTYVPGESFGELALLYNAPRAASIYCKETSVCFTLDRATFNHIVKDATMRKRERFENFLSRVDILKSLDSYERNKICDCLQTQKYKEGDYIIREGDHGNTFFFIESGTGKALKKNSSGGETMVYEYKENDYFGELA